MRSLLQTDRKQQDAGERTTRPETMAPRFPSPLYSTHSCSVDLRSSLYHEMMVDLRRPLDLSASASWLGEACECDGCVCSWLSGH